MQKISKKIKKIIFKIIPPTLPSYSQAGEDAVINFLFNDYGKKQIQYLDLGTNIPHRDNNTYLFYKKGSSGVCVEADGSLINKQIVK